LPSRLVAIPQAVSRRRRSIRTASPGSIMTDAVTYKYLAAPLTKAQFDALVAIPERNPQGN